VILANLPIDHPAKSHSAFTIGFEGNSRKGMLRYSHGHLSAIVTGLKSISRTLISSTPRRRSRKPSASRGIYSSS
jgi:hypothetical protein